MWGKAQQIGTPILGVAYLYECGTTQVAKTCQSMVYVYPDNLDVSIDVQTQSRTKGIYEVPLYSSVVKLKFKFSEPQFEDIPQQIESK